VATIIVMIILRINCPDWPIGAV